MKDRLESRFPADSLSLRLLTAAAALITIATGLAFIGGIVFSESVRDVVSDFLTADLKVWHLLVAVGVLVVGGFIIMRLRRTGSPPEGVRWPREIDRYGVKWPITAARVGGELEFEAGRPKCFECRTPLGRDLGEGDEPLPIPGAWKDLPTKAMTFRCPKDGLAYDLTKYGIPMWWAVKNVEGDATGKYDTALRGAGQ